MVSFIVGYHTESTDIHYCIGKQIVENTAVPRYRTGRNPYQKIPCMCDARVGQHSLYIILSQSDKITGNHRNDGYDLNGIGPNLQINKRKHSRSEEHTSELQSRGHLVC